MNKDLIISFLSTWSFLFTLGLQNPYLVLMDGSVSTCKLHADAIGFDAISAYTPAAGGTLQVNSVWVDEIRIIFFCTGCSVQWWSSEKWTVSPINLYNL